MTHLPRATLDPARFSSDQPPFKNASDFIFQPSPLGNTHQYSQVIQGSNSRPITINLQVNKDQNARNAHPAIIKRGNLTNTSPAFANGKIKKHNAYMGYMQLQNMTSSNNNAIINPQQVSVQQNYNNQSKSERSIEHSQGISGVGMNPSSISRGVKHFKTKHMLTSRETHHQSMLLLSQDQHVILRTEESEEQNKPKSVSYQRKLTRVKTTGAIPPQINASIGSANSPNGFNNKSSTSLNNKIKMINGSKVQNIIQMLKSGEFKTPQITSNPDSSRGNIQSIFAATSLYGNKTMDIRSRATVRSMDRGQKSQYSIPEQSYQQSTFARQESHQFVATGGDYSPEGKPKIHIRQVHRSQSPPTANSVNQYGLQSVSNNNNSQLTYYHQGNQIRVKVPRGSGQSGLLNIVGNNSNLLEEVKEDRFKIIKSNRSLSIGKRGSLPENSSNLVIIASRSIKGGPPSFRRRTGSSLKRDSTSSAARPATNHQQSKSSQNIHENSGQSNNNVTQKSFRIHNESKRNSQKVSGRNQFNQTQNPMKIKSSAFIDRTIKTSTSQFISPKTQAIQINKTTAINSFNNPQIQFFNYPNNPQKANKDQDMRNSKFSQSRMIQHFIIRQAFMKWGTIVKKVQYNLTRLELMDNFSFNEFSQLGSNLKIGNIMCREHMKSIKSFMKMQEMNLLTEANQKNAKSEFQNIIQQEIKSLQESKRLTSTASGSNKFIQVQELSLFSIAMKLLDSHVNPDYQSQMIIQLTLQDVTIFYDHDLQALEKIFKQMFDILNKTLSQLVQFQFSEINTAYHRVQQDIANLRDYLIGINQSIELKALLNMNVNQDQGKQTDSDHELWILFTSLKVLIDELFINKKQTFHFFKLDASLLHNTLSTFINKQMKTLESRFQNSLLLDTTLLKQDLQSAIECLNSTASISLNSYIERVNTIKVLNHEMCEQMRKRHESIRSISKMIQVSQQVESNISQISELLVILPDVIEECKNKMKQQRPQIEKQIYQGCLSLSSKIHTFEKKYIEKYISSWEEKTNVSLDSIIGEILTRDKIVNEIEAKVLLYLECIEIIGLQEVFSKFKDVTCNEDLQRLKNLTHATLQVWQNYQKWSIFKEQLIFRKPVTQINYLETLNMLQSFQNTQQSSEQLKDFHAHILQNVSQVRLMIDQMKDFILSNNNESILKKKHWIMIFQTIQMPYKEGFTLHELNSLNMKSTCPKIQQIIALARQENTYNQVINEAKQSLTMSKLKLSQFNEEIFMISDFDPIKSILEDHYINLKKIITKDLQIQEQSEETKKQIQEIIEIIKKIDEVQKILYSLKAYMSNTLIQESLPDQWTEYQSIIVIFKDQISNQLESNTNILNILENEYQLTLAIDYLMQKSQLIKKALDTFFDTQRNAFPRFYFMPDQHYLEYLNQSNNIQAVNSMTNSLFPGASHLLISENSLPKSQLDQLDESIFKTGMKIQCENNIVSEQDLIRGMVSEHKEILMFQKPVAYQGKPLTQWLSGVETAMQQTIGHLIGQAVASFPKQSLDEWILDFPLQTIMTTIHLILTHEINELFDEQAKGDEQEEYLDEYGQGQFQPNNGIDQFHGALHTRTPDTRDLVVATASSRGAHYKKVGNHHQRTISLQNINEDFLKKNSRKSVQGHQRIKSCHQMFQQALFFVREEQHIDELLIDEQSPITVVDEEWIHFRKDMFGSDFDIEDEVQIKRKQAIVSGNERDETMAVLQEKSFKGLYLRLQFWINQICKMLKTSNDTCIKHNPLQRVMMQTIISFLSYMRDVVYELKVKQVTNIEDFEWQKQMRLTWQGNQGDDTRGCKVDCGAWSTYQANEYIGNQIYRLPLTPLTNKYYVFIAAALREKSAVLFRCIPTHDYSQDVFSEFANLCTVPLKKFPCTNKNVSMKNLMQHLNGAALASTWIFFEHIDKLDYLHLQTFNKEIQMVQQQFIIAELSQDDEESQQSHLPLPEQQQSMSSFRPESSQMMISSPFTNQRRECIDEIVLPDQIPIPQRSSNKMIPLNHRNQKPAVQTDSNPQSTYYQELQSVDHTQQTRPLSNPQSSSKVCFGVFASLSHRFALKHEMWAAEISTSLQSAFRVLSLTRPDLTLITSLYLKSHDFLYYHSLSQSIHEFFALIHEQMPSNNERDDSFSLTVREMRRLTECCGIMKSMKIEGNRMENEKQIVSEVVEMFVKEKLYSYINQNKIEEAVLSKIIAKSKLLIFGQTSPSTIPINNLEIDPNIKKAFSIKGWRLDQTRLEQFSFLIESLHFVKPVCLIGPEQSGKNAAIKLMCSQFLKKVPLYFNPEVFGTYRELYGINDPISQTQMNQQEQTGILKYSLISILMNELSTNERILIIDGELDSPFNETLLPLLEYQQFQNIIRQNKFELVLPNGLFCKYPVQTPIVYKTISLAKATPRMVSSLRIINYSQNNQNMHAWKFENIMEKCNQKKKYSIIAQLFNELKSNFTIEEVNTKIKSMLTVFKAILKQIIKPITEKTINSLLLVSAGILQISTKSIDDLKINLQINKATDLSHIYFDPVSQDIKMSQPYCIENYLVITPQFQQAKYYQKLLTSINKDFQIIGESGTSKTTLLNYLAQNQNNSYVIPCSSFIKAKQMTQILLQQPKSINLIIIDDAHLNNHYQFVKYARSNGNYILSNDHQAMQKLQFQKFAILLSSNSKQVGCAYYNLQNDISKQFLRPYLQISNLEQSISAIKSLIQKASIQVTMHTISNAVKLLKITGANNQLGNCFKLNIKDKQEVFKILSYNQPQYDQVDFILKLLSQEKIVSLIGSSTHILKELQKKSGMTFFEPECSRFDDFQSIMNQIKQNESKVIVLKSTIQSDYQYYEIFMNFVYNKDNLPIRNDIQGIMIFESEDKYHEIASKVAQLRNIVKYKLYKQFEIKSDQDYVLIQMKDQLTELVEKLNISLPISSLKIPLDYFTSQQRFQDFKALYCKLKILLQSSLSTQIQTLSLHAQKYQQLLQSTTTSSNIHNSFAQYDLMNIQERLDSMSVSLKNGDQSIRLLEKNNLELQKQYDELTLIKKKSEECLKQADKMRKMIEIIETKELEYHEIRKDPKQLLSQTLCQVLKIKTSLKEVKFTELCFRLKQLVVSDNKLSEITMNMIQQLRNAILDKLPAQSLSSLLIHFMLELFFVTANLKPFTQQKKLIQVRDQLSLNEAQITFQRSQLILLREEPEELLIKESNIKIDPKSKDVSKVIKNEYMMKAVIKQGKSSIQKLEKVKMRFKTLEGDSFMLAVSVAYLSIIPMEERNKVRQELAERLLLKANLETNECWSNIENEQLHCKYFKKVIEKDLKLGLDMFSSVQHLVADSVMAECLFSMIFAPSLPVILDSTGLQSEYLMSKFYQNATKIDASSYLSENVIKSKLEQSEEVIVLQDLNDFSKSHFGRCQDFHIFSALPQLMNLQRPKISLPNNPEISIPKVQIHSDSYKLNLGQDFLQTSTIIDASLMNKSEAWIELKQILLKHFLPDSFQRLQVVLTQIKSLKVKLKQKQLHFDSLYLSIDSKDDEVIRNCYVELRQLDEDYQQLNQAFHQMINEHPLLASYSNILVIMFNALKEVTKYTEEVSYSWKIYVKVIDMIVSKIIRDLTLNMKNKEGNSQSSEAEESERSSIDLKISQLVKNPDISQEYKKKKQRKEKEFTIDEEFFHQVIMPGIYSTIISGTRQEYISLFNLLFSLEIALKKGSISEQEKTFFLHNFLSIHNFYDWRLNIHRPSTVISGFVSQPHTKMSDYIQKKKAIISLYPDMKKQFELLEMKLGNRKDFTYYECSQVLKSMFKLSKVPLIKKLIVGFICPDNEWRSILCQFVYEELTTIFDFTEDLNKLHNFIKTASWNLPIALLTQNSINIINTVCSIASYYGVGLEVLRTDTQQSVKIQQTGYYWNHERQANCQYLENKEVLSDEAATLHQINENSSKQNHKRMFAKDEMDIDEKQHIATTSQIDLIQKCAENGTWVLISTLKFPTYWKQVCDKLQRLSQKGKIQNTFRIFFDLQGYSVQEIPQSFMFDHSVRFYLTDKNNEDMEGFNDVWANILNDDLLNAKELNNVYILDDRPKSSQSEMKDNILESSIIENLLPKLNQSNQHATILSSRSSIIYENSIVLPNFFSRGYMDEIAILGRDLQSPPRGQLSRINVQSRKQFKSGMLLETDSDLSKISLREDDLHRASLAQSFLGTPLTQNFINPSKLQPKNAFNSHQTISEEVKIQQRKKASSRGSQVASRGSEVNQKKVDKRIEMVAAKIPGKRLQPAQKHS